MPYTQTDALNDLRLKVAQTADPALTDADLISCLSQCVRASVWAANTAYSVGQRVVPPPANGRIYLCSVAGTSSATAPTFSLTGLGFTTTDNTITWVDDGAQPAKLWDINAAASLAWTLKAARVTERVDFTDNGTSVSREQVYRHCLAMAARFSRTWVA